MRRSDELISLLRSRSERLVELFKKLNEEAERLKMRAYTRSFDYDYNAFENLMDQALNEISSLIDVVREVADTLVDESAPVQVKQLLEQMSEKLDSLFQVARDAVKVSKLSRDEAEALFNELHDKLSELLEAAEEVASAAGLLIDLVKRRSEEFDFDSTRARRTPPPFS